MTPEFLTKEPELYCESRFQRLWVYEWGNERMQYGSSDSGNEDSL